MNILFDKKYFEFIKQDYSRLTIRQDRDRIRFYYCGRTMSIGGFAIDDLRSYCPSVKLIWEVIVDDLEGKTWKDHVIWEMTKHEKQKILSILQAIRDKKPYKYLLD